MLGQVWYLIVSIPDLCTLTYFYMGLQYQFSHAKVNLITRGKLLANEEILVHSNVYLETQTSLGNTRQKASIVFVCRINISEQT